MGVEHNKPPHLLDRYIKGGDINGGRLYSTCCYTHLVLSKKASYESFAGSSLPLLQEAKLVMGVFRPFHTSLEI